MGWTRSIIPLFITSGSKRPTQVPVSSFPMFAASIFLGELNATPRFGREGSRGPTIAQRLLLRPHVGCLHRDGEAARDMDRDTLDISVFGCDGLECGGYPRGGQ